MQPQPPNPGHKRMKREKKTIGYMVDIYCKDHHSTQGELCAECIEFRTYAFLRLDKCPFQEKKSTCGKCIIHCYKPDMKEKVKIVMRYSGPRMLLHHPSLAFHHAWDARRKPPKLVRKAS
jgi:hypothetical protein